MTTLLDYQTINGMIPRIYIVDDEAPARARLRTVLSDIAEACPHILVGEAEHAQAALEGIAATAPDVVLVDVQMPEVTGLQLVQQLKQGYAGYAGLVKDGNANFSIAAEMPIIIFVTAYEHYAVNAFDVHAFDYLLKPVRAVRLQQALLRATQLRFPSATKIQENISLPGSDPVTRSAAVRTHFSVQERGRVLLVPIDEVRFLKAELKYVILRTKSKEYLIEDSLMSIEEELRAQFVRVHRNTLVARNAIVGVERGSLTFDKNDDDGSEKKLLPVLQQTWNVILRDVEQKLPISRRQWSIIRALVRC
ncbi:LytTR family DNA-binding domain-containing protein [Glaciimonas sp. CA11.2]|uniref:LytR/AlgR family response regulator transcription factor n=1 Tax=unclassified Glaciimonas TaxID=2644401 RepID=UPI002AB3C836|nr:MULTISPECIES: LytTR family DNA-binding domain-containing protein [unclassified Glaciimonas]MDY7544996.1 LytTR family DNA-binding domain-containing protein [Glaciimonas sp. CA11.2]MEB0013299.1 LytTR family DNA-binding domain-containing protein [Glaciimonas sp. Cout2]MEB0082460.1 LytTR family DNA-binding domain-containing protein [Glaciimonas sp. Gout2]MEB0163770.1 LytTR family DNA-binding domain-containing protein [Glaciimonas sp. CA11.2]